MWGYTPQPMCACTCHRMGGTMCTDCDHVHQGTVGPKSTPELGSDVNGTRDGKGAADHDATFEFGKRPTVTWPYPFSQSEFARLLIARGRARDKRDAA